MKEFTLRKLLFIVLLAYPVISFPQIESVKKIWDQAPHNAFTDLIRYKLFFYCVFREGISHVPKDTTQNGKIRILRSADGENWQSVALLSHSRYDLRDPKISVTPDGRLMVLMGGSYYVNGKLTGMQSHVSFSDDGKSFHYPLPVSIEQDIKTGFDWIWRITWDGQTGYGISYQPDPSVDLNRLKLLKTTDGIKWKQVTEYDVKPMPNEATIRFDNDDNMIILLRREAGANGMLGISYPPYLKCKWTELNYRLGGPDFIILNNLLCIGTRQYNTDGTRCVIYITDKNGRIKKTVELPGGGDTSYPGIVNYKGCLWVSYYSSHDGKASIYIARIKFRTIKDLQ